MNYKEEIIRNIANKMASVLTIEQLQKLESELAKALYQYDVTLAEHSLSTEINKDQQAIQGFFVAKKIEGLSDNSLRYYTTILKQFFSVVTVPLERIEANSIRYYLAVRMDKGISKVSLDNELRVLKSFFNWLTAEDYINKSPVIGIKPIKKEKRIKKPFSEVELEKIRRAANDNKSEFAKKRDTAIVEFLYSTGARVSELVNTNKQDISNDECLVFGKGSKERTVFLNAKCKLALTEYLNVRKDNNPALFVTGKSPYNRLEKSGVETLIRNLGKQAQVEDCHPHRFRRTMATTALNRGMPLEEISQLLGHEDLKTTTIYARSEKENVKSSHRKYVV